MRASSNVTSFLSPLFRRREKSKTASLALATGWITEILRVGGSRPHTVRFPELSLFTVRGVIHSRIVRGVIESCRALVAASCHLDRVVCRDWVVITFVTARVHSAPLRALPRATHDAGRHPPRRLHRGHPSCGHPAQQQVL